MSRDGHIRSVALEKIEASLVPLPFLHSSTPPILQTSMGRRPHNQKQGCPTCDSREPCLCTKPPCACPSSSCRCPKKAVGWESKGPGRGYRYRMVCRSCRTSCHKVRTIPCPHCRTHCSSGSRAMVGVYGSPKYR